LCLSLDDDRLLPLKLKSFIVIVSLFAGICLKAQKRSKYEWWWAFTHPIAAIKVKHISKRCYTIYNSRKSEGIPDNFSNGGKLDAFRHVFFMASFAQKVKPKKLRKLGIAHEKGNQKQFKRLQPEDGEIPDSLSTVMDLDNNEIGILIGSSNKSLSSDSLEKLVLTRIAQGNSTIMKRRKDGTYLDCIDKPIDLKLYFKCWSVPKCLVKSNYIYH
jgi:hypothetical protein